MRPGRDRGTVCRMDDSRKDALAALYLQVTTVCVLDYYAQLRHFLNACVKALSKLSDCV